MAQGTVKWFSAGRGYGFIAPDDVFVHQSAIQAEGYRSLQDNQRVEYTARRGPKGTQAEQVQPLKSVQPRWLPTALPAAGTGGPAEPLRSRGADQRAGRFGAGCGCLQNWMRRLCRHGASELSPAHGAITMACRRGHVSG